MTADIAAQLRSQKAGSTDPERLERMAREAEAVRIDYCAGDRKRVDDVAIRAAGSFRLEMMAHNRAWLQVETPAGHYTFWIQAHRSTLKITEGEHELRREG